MIWDPYETLELCNPDREAFTCVGYAPTQGRRCRNPIAAHNKAAVQSLLDKMASKSPTSSGVAKLLPEIAPLSLCVRDHQNQVQRTVCQWESIIRSISTFKTEPSSNFREDLDLKTSSGASWEDSKSSSNSASMRLTQMVEELEQKNEVLKQEVEALREQKAKLESQNLRLWSEKFGLVGEKLVFATQNSAIQSELETVKRERDDLKQKVQEKMDKGKDESEREQKAREEEVREREQRRNEQEKRERDERTERIRQAAQRKREERERQARENAEKEKREWEEAWKKYIDGWTAFKKSSTTTPTTKPCLAMPWPVKSGRYSDVVASNVKAFFENACPEGSSAAKTFSTLTNEMMKWHPDKVLVLLKEYTEAEKMIVEMIFRVVLELRKGARDRVRGG